MGSETRDDAIELRAVTALFVMGDKPQLVGPCTLVTNGNKTIAFSSSELLRRASEPLAVALTEDFQTAIQVASWSLAPTAGLGIIELATRYAANIGHDVDPLDVGALCAAVETRGAPAALVAVSASERGFSRSVVPVHVDAWDGGGMRDDILHFASPKEASHAGTAIEGTPLFAWMPPDPVLGRAEEVVAVAVAVGCRGDVVKLRELPPIAQLLGLHDLGAVLPYRGRAESGNDLDQVAGEIKRDPTSPLPTVDVEK